MASQPGLQKIAIHILYNVSQSKGKQRTEFGQLKKKKRDVFFFKNYAENKARRLVIDFFLFIKKV